jgi:hypothetical protein
MMKIKINIKSISLQTDKHYDRDQFKRAFYEELIRLLGETDPSKRAGHVRAKYAEAQELLPRDRDDARKIGAFSAGLIYDKIHPFIE